MKAYIVIPRVWKPWQGPVRHYFRWLRTQPCAVCASWRGVESTHAGARDIGRKADARQTIPLCRVHRTAGALSLNKLGPARFGMLYHLDVTKMSEELQAIYGVLASVSRVDSSGPHRLTGGAR